MLPLRFSQRNSTGCQNATLNQIFLELSLLWEGALCFFFDLANVFLQGATMPKLQPIFLELSLWEGALFLLRLNEGISSGWRHATPKPPKFLDLSFWEGGIMRLLRLNQGISLGFHRARPTIKKFRLFIIVGRVHYASAST